jgi:hypothetical protein
MLWFLFQAAFWALVLFVVVGIACLPEGDGK